MFEQNFFYQRVIWFCVNLFLDDMKPSNCLVLYYQIKLKLLLIM